MTSITVLEQAVTEIKCVVVVNWLATATRALSTLTKDRGSAPVAEALNKGHCLCTKHESTAIPAASAGHRGQAPSVYVQ